MSESDLAALLARGVGITNLVPVATARADELTRQQLSAGRARLEAFVARHRPRVVAVLGITAYRAAFGRPRATAGRQPEPIGGAQLWVVPNPSGLNAHETVASLAAAYAEPVRAAGIELAGRGTGGGETEGSPPPPRGIGG
jgi:double-stranded uracil-DNA glycosylase